MPESKRLLEAEATRALDRDNESGTRLVVPEDVYLTDEEIDERVLASVQVLEASTWTMAGLSLSVARAQTEKAYPMGFDAGFKSRDAVVAGLQQQLDLKGKELAQQDGFYRDMCLVAKNAEAKRDAALEQVALLQDLARELGGAKGI